MSKLSTTWAIIQFTLDGRLIQGGHVTKSKYGGDKKTCEGNRFHSISPANNMSILTEISIQNPYLFLQIFAK